MPYARREILRQVTRLTAVGSLINSGDLAGLSEARAADVKVSADIVRLRPEIEPLVELIERTERTKCFDMMSEQLRRGCSYRQFLAALFLAGIRNVSPQPPGFKFHCVFVIHSAHQLSLDAPIHERLLPLFWALDNFKRSQQQDISEGDFHLAPVKGRLPAPNQAWREFHEAMEQWDEPRADRAIVALVRSRGAHEIIEGLWRYGARDYRNIGHKAIFVANSWRTLQTIGWQHAEPVLRSLTLGLLDFGKKEELNGYGFDDQCYLPNLELVSGSAAKLPPSWVHSAGSPDTDATLEMLSSMRDGETDEVCRKAVLELVDGKLHASELWNAVHLAAGELMMRLPGILGVHAITASNALRYSFRVAGSPDARLLLALQAIGWMTQFRNFMRTRDGFGDAVITDLGSEDAAAPANVTVEEILSLVSSDRPQAARKAFRYAQANPDAREFKQAAQSLIFAKARDNHDYKYAAAVFEDHQHANRRWQPHLLATAAYNLRGSDLADSALMERAREASRSIAL